MLFNSLNFLLFFPVILILFYLLKKEYRWILLLAGSILFYMAWKAEYILLISAYIIVNYFSAIKIEDSASPAHKKYILYFAVVFNIGILFIFKYFNFFIDNVNSFFALINVDVKSEAVNLILPMGISFYTFQIMSYTIDVYKYNLKAERHFGIFYLFVTFFPQLVAGPIERAGNLIAQLRDLSNKLNSEDVIRAVQLIILGFFKKLVIADRLSPYVDQVYSFPEGYSGLNIALATFFFSVQIYCDFSGYTDIAIGSARLLGVRLMDNFKTPYFARTISEFWSRWHISLSTWFRDYVYIPLGGNRTVKWRWYYNLLITFTISGFWHGANWTFIIWGILHGSYLVFSLLSSRHVEPLNNWIFGRIPKLKAMLDVLVTFILVYFAWIFFRAENVQDAFYIIRKIVTLTSDLGAFTVAINNFGVFSFMVSLLTIGLLFLYELGLYFDKVNKNFGRVVFTSSVLFALILLLGVMGSKSFIYFQF